MTEGGGLMVWVVIADCGCIALYYTFLSDDGNDDDEGEDTMGGMVTKSNSSKGMGMVMGNRVLRGN
jgi:hypothetical protein